jgi:hypothetical protein
MGEETLVKKALVKSQDHLESFILLQSYGQQKKGVAAMKCRAQVVWISIS